jgi:hypothetical protein
MYELSKPLINTMCTCYRFTGIATLIIGLQLFSSTLIDMTWEFGFNNTVSSHSSLVASTSNDSSRVALINPSNHSFNPPDNQGPDITRGSGTR